MLKGLKVFSLGIAIWSLSLLLPEINLLLSPKVMIGLAVVFGTAMLIWELAYHLKGWHHPSDGAKNNHCSRPVPPIALAGR